MALSDRRSALRTLAGSAVAAATSTFWVETLSALSKQQAHAHAADAAIAAQDWTPTVLSAAQNDAVVVLTELIIPATDTPGAKVARVNRFVDRVLQEATPTVRDPFLKGLAWIDARSQAMFGRNFVDAGAENQTKLLTALDGGRLPAEDAIGVQFFQSVKSMTIDGYYTSEIGLRQELGDPGQLFLPQFPGCDHPEHQG